MHLLKADVPLQDVVNVTSTIPGLLAVDTFGRRPLLFWGAIGMLVCQFIVSRWLRPTGSLRGLPDFLLQAAAVGSTLDTDPANKAFVAFICIYIFFFASTWGPLAW